MNRTRRGLLKAIVAAPWVITTPGLLMPVRSFTWPTTEHLPLIETFLSIDPAVPNTEAMAIGFVHHVGEKMFEVMLMPSALIGDQRVGAPRIMLQRPRIAGPLALGDIVYVGPDGFVSR